MATLHLTLLLTALIRVPSTASNSRPNRSSWRQSSTNLRNTWPKALRLSRRKSAMVLKSGFRCRSSQITSILRLRLGLQPAARPHPVRVAVDVELQQIRRRIARAVQAQVSTAPAMTCELRHRSAKAGVLIACAPCPRRRSPLPFAASANTPGFTTAMLDHGTAQLGAQLPGCVVRSGDHGVVLAGYAL